MCAGVAYGLIADDNYPIPKHFNSWLVVKKWIIIKDFPYRCEMHPFISIFGLIKPIKS